MNNYIFLVFIPFVFLTIILVIVSMKYSFDRRHYKNTSRRAANTIENTNTTVVYTIPTTGQLTTTYPELQGQFANTHNRPPPYVSSGESPPSYDQAISTTNNQQGSLVIK